MKIVIAPDSFKGSLTAKEAASNIEIGVRNVFKHADIIKIPMADGGEGTVQSLVDSTGGKIIKVRVKGPLLDSTEAFFGILGDGKTAVIEMAAASGLLLLSSEERNPLKTTTYGTGELIKHALNYGCRTIILGIGGSATNDGGSGMAKALGAKLLDCDGNDIGFGGESLSRLSKIDISQLDESIKDTIITVACDVANPLCGPNGASHVFGPQKGADAQMAELLDRNLAHFSDVIKETLQIDIKDIPGAGAAGGLGGGLLAFLNAKLRKGIDIVTEAVNLEKEIVDADLVITGEGMMDFQTQFGKTPFGVAKIAKKYNKPVIAIVGSIGRDAEVLYDMGIDTIFSLVDKPMSLDEAMTHSAVLLQKTAERIMRLFKITLEE